MRSLLLLLSFIVLLACNDAPSREKQGESGLLGLLGDFDDSEIAYGEAIQLNSSVPTPIQEVSQQIIKNASLRYETQDLEKTKQQVAATIKANNGYIQNDDSGKDYNQLYQRMTVRVPTQNFEQTLDGISQGVSYFDERTISQKDVTEEFIDLSARLKAKRALENRYLALLSKAKNVKEMLEIERELSHIREEIESKEGRLKYLKNQVSESTIYIHFYKVTADQGVTQSYGSKIINAFKSGWNGVSVFFLGLLHLWPFLILGGIALFFIKRWRNKKKK